MDAGIFLDTDTVLLDDPALLWDRSPIEDLVKLLGQTAHRLAVILFDKNCFRFQLFSPFTALALAPVEAHYSVAKVRVYSVQCTHYIHRHTPFPTKSNTIGLF